MSNIYSTAQIADRYGLHVKTVQRLIRAGVFGQPIRTARKVYVTDEGLSQYEHRERQHPQAVSSSRATRREVTPL